MDSMPNTNFSPEDIQALMDLGITQDRIRELTSKYEGAEDRRYNTQMPGMHTAGSVSVAANPLEFVGKGIREYRAGKQMGDIESQRKIEQGNQARIRGDMADRWLGKPQGPQMSPIPGAMPPGQGQLPPPPTPQPMMGGAPPPMPQGAVKPPAPPMGGGMPPQQGMGPPQARAGMPPGMSKEQMLAMMMRGQGRGVA